MKIYDISMEIKPSMAIWRGREERKPKFQIIADFDSEGKGSRLTQVTLDMHTGTHVDSPLHFIKGGASIEETTLEQLIRPIKLFDHTSVVDCITKENLLNLDIEKNDFILFKTKNSYSSDFRADFVYLDESGAKYLASKQIAGVGIDSLGIERDQANYGTHLSLLGENIIIIEGLRLEQVEEGRYFMVAAPLKLVGVEAAPARIFLLEALDI